MEGKFLISRRGNPYQAFVSAVEQTKVDFSLASSFSLLVFRTGYMTLYKTTDTSCIVARSDTYTDLGCE